ncbi:MAG TPA: 3'-5' exonuclease [Gemmatimonadetes bacterium]|nr:3'-5' exonuclease [Gemmatimonadota bacterium]
MHLPLELDRPLVFFDIETTGLDIRNDRIVELALIKITPQGDVIERVRRFNPGVQIPTEVTAIHGITDQDVANEPTFCLRSKSLAALIEGADLAGFNIRGFDLHMLVSEFKRCGINLDVRNRRLIDMQNIFHREEPRDLSAAAEFYLGRKHEEAHQALGDIRTTAAVLSAQLERYPHLPQDVDGLHNYCDQIRPFRTGVDLWFSGLPEERVFRKGKNKGQNLADIALTSPDYLRWMLSLDDLDEDVVQVIEEALDAPVLQLPLNAPKSGSD